MRLFYGEPFDLLSVGGYTAWRVGGFLSIVAAVWGMLAAVRALRAEEDAGRQELVLAGVVSRRQAYLSVLGAIAAGAALLWLALFAALVAARLPAGGSAYLALAIVVVAPVFVGVGALASQLAPSRRVALELGCAAVTLALVVRVVADTSSGLEWLRWATPLGWSEELRPFTGAQPRRPAAAARGGGARARLSAAAIAGAPRHRQRAALRPRQRAAAIGGLSSPTALALRSERGSLAGWLRRRAASSRSSSGSCRRACPRRASPATCSASCRSSVRCR